MEKHFIRKSLKKGYILNLPNGFSLGRILLIPVFMAFFLSKLPYSDWIAVAVFTVAAISDGLDGYIARSQKQQTLFGLFLDPLADKLLVSAALISLVERSNLSSWVAMVIIGREFAVSGLRLMAIAEKRIIPSSAWGKTKTVLQIIAIIAWILIPRISKIGAWGAYFPYLASVLMALTIVVTIISGAIYFIRSKDVL